MKIIKICSLCKTNDNVFEILNIDRCTCHTPDNRRINEYGDYEIWGMCKECFDKSGIEIKDKNEPLRQQKVFPN